MQLKARPKYLELVLHTRVLSQNDRAPTTFLVFYNEFLRLQSNVIQINVTIYRAHQSGHIYKLPHLRASERAINRGVQIKSNLNLLWPGRVLELWEGNKRKNIQPPLFRRQRLKRRRVCRCVVIIDAYKEIICLLCSTCPPTRTIITNAAPTPAIEFGRLRD